MRQSKAAFLKQNRLLRYSLENYIEASGAC
jgi:hypothetical protein